MPTALSDPANPAGYFNGLAQPDQTLTIRLKASPATIDLKALDDWLHRNLGVALSGVRSQAHEGMDDQDERLALLMMDRILATAATLQRAASLPVFEDGRILGIMADPDTAGAWRVEVAVPRVDYIPQRLTNQVYDAAVLIVIGLTAGSQRFADMQTVYREIEERILNPLRAVLPAGKSTLHVLRAAQYADIPWRHLSNGIFQLGWGRHSLRLKRSKTGSDSSLGADAAQHKFLAAQWMRQAGLPTPLHRLADTEEEAVQAARELGWPLVVKPENGDRGEGVTIQIDSETALLAAVHAARQYSKQILVERMATGVCHRLLIVRGKVIYVVKRLPVAVAGDGTSTVAALIQTANAKRLATPPWHRTPPYPADELAINSLRQAGFDLDSTPLKGSWAPLRPIESTEWGGVDEDFSSTLHPDNAVLAIRAAELFGLDVAGVDLISPDITRPWHENGAVVTEVNSAPVLGASQSSRETMPEAMATLMPEGGRIPIEVVIGGAAAFDRARERQLYWSAQGYACCLTSHERTHTVNGDLWPMAARGIYARCTALLMNRRVGALILVVQNDELLHTGLPVDRADRVELMPDIEANGQDLDATMRLAQRLQQ